MPKEMIKSNVFRKRVGEDSTLLFLICVMDNNEIKYWKEFLKTLQIIPPETSEEYQIRCYFLKRINEHISRIESVREINSIEYKILWKHEDLQLYSIYHKKDLTEDILLNACSNCSLREKCTCGKEYCITLFPNNKGIKFFIEYSEWIRILYKEGF